MEKKEYLKELVEDMHSVILATLDEDGKPSTRVVDMMLSDGMTVYFLTAKGKELYGQLMDQQYVSISGILGKKSITIRGNVLNIGQDKLEEIFAKNTYMQKIYPEDKRDILEVFRIEKGSGEFFDISDPARIERDSFVIGEGDVPVGGYYVNDACILCGTCYAVCPQQCIDTAKNPVVIDQDHCLRCGACIGVCPVNAIEKK